MGYSDGEALILTRVQAASGFSSTNTSRGDWLILNRGASDHYAILRMGEFSGRWLTANQYQANWTTTIEVWQLYTDDAVTRTNLYGHLAAVIAGLLNYPHLGGAIEDSTIEGGSEPQRAWEREGGPQWLFCSVRVRWDETTTINFAE